MTPADELRSLLADSEKLLGNLRGQGAAAGRLLENMDRIAELWPELEAVGVDLRPEAGRWETVQALTHKHAAAIVREMRGAREQEPLRGSRGAGERPRSLRSGVIRSGGGGEQRSGGDLAPTDGAQAGVGWWWHLDEEVRERNRKATTRLAVIAAILVLAIGGGIFLLQKLFPTDPHVMAASRYMTDGQQKIENSGDYAGALADFQAAAQALPGDPEPWIWVGVAQQQVGDRTAAQQAFDKAQALTSQQDFLLQRASIETIFKQYDAALADLGSVLKADPESPEGYYTRATVYEAQGRIAEAVQDLQKASEYADKRKMAQLVAVSRVRLGMLVQRLNAMPDVTPTPTP